MFSRFSNRAYLAAIAALLVCSVRAHAQKLYVNSQDPYNYPGNGSGSSEPGNGGLYFNSPPNVGLYGFGHTTTNVTASFGGSANITQSMFTRINSSIHAYQSLWVDFRNNANTLNAAEVGELNTFIGAGKRVLFIGENNGWTTWNNSFLALFGATTDVPACAFGTAGVAMSHLLTSGISGLDYACSSFSNSGTQLFNQNIAALRGSAQNVLTVYDSDIFDDYYGSSANNVRFSRNVGDWLAYADQPPGVAPEPASMVLLATGLVGIAAAVRRRRS